MLGNFQQSQLRLEVEAAAPVIRESLTKIPQLRQWLAPLPLGEGLPECLTPGVALHTGIGFATLTQTVDRVGDDHLRLILSGAIDGFHEWYWGDGWVQSRLEGISLLPLNLGQTVSLLKLRQFVTGVKAQSV
ncbi:hypothetical protein IQ225_01100 [Synechocystis salina LEGE 06155]|nr:hypothetical protein [Synechocystis salina LEGE 06155]